MKLRSSKRDTVRLIRAEDGVQVVVDNGTEVTILDDVGVHRHLANSFYRKGDECVMHDGALHYVAHDDLVWFEEH